MGEYFPGKMKIGGKLSLTAPEGTSQEDWDDSISQFIARVTDEFKDWDQKSYTARDMSIQDLAKEIDEHGNLTVANSEASWGSFQDLESLCFDLGLSFDRHSEARYEYDAEIVRWRPGMDEPEVVASNQGGHIMLRLSALERARGILGIYDRSKVSTVDTMAKILCDAQDALDEVLPKRLMDVPKFELVGGT